MLSSVKILPRVCGIHHQSVIACGISSQRYFSNAGSSHAGGGEGVSIPVYSRSGETTEVKRARLLYQSRKRGMLENGLLLSTFASHHLNSLSPAQLDEYDELINKPSNDWDIYHWITGKQQVPQEYNNSVMTMLKEHVQNKNREWRGVQPKLD